MPVLTEGDWQLAETTAIAQYVAKQFGTSEQCIIQKAIDSIGGLAGLAGDTDREEADILSWALYVYSHVDKFSPLRFEKDEAKRAEIEKKLKDEIVPKLQAMLSRRLVQTKGYLVGEKV